MTTTADRNAPAPRAFKVIGTRPIRHDGYDKVTGRAKYGADVQMAGMLYGAVLRSPHAHARIVKIDTSKAEAMPGVHAVVTSKDFPATIQPYEARETLGDPNVISENSMARAKVLYRGHALAAVAADSQHIAQEALARIAVEYAVLPAVLDVREAMKPGAPQLHEHLESGNIAKHSQFKGGDLAAGFKQADITVELEFTTQPVHQGYIEPHNSTALWGQDGNLTVWTSTQGAFVVRAQTAAMLNLPQSRVRVIPMEIGGGFGGKIPVYLDAVAALLSQKTRRPVKLVMSRREVFEGTGPAAGTYMRVKMGATKQGKITAAEAYFAFAAGAFPGSPVGSAMNTGIAPYKVDNFQIDGYDVVVNKPRVAAYRAPGSPQGAYAIEQVVDALAKKLGMDPMEFRLKNVTRTGDRAVTGVVFPSIGTEEVERAIASHPHYKSKLTGKNRGRGVSMGYWGNAGMASSVTINVNADGAISLVSGSVDIGGTRPAVAMQAAEILGITAQDVHPSVGDTDSVGYTGVTGGSRTAFATGMAAIKAAEEIIRLLKGRVALLWETQPDVVDFQDGVFISRKNPKDTMTFKQIAGKMSSTGGPVTASAQVDATKFIGPSAAGMIVDVEVDPETGKVTILRCTAFQDVGKAAHPSYVEGQIQGGTVQGIGWALNEEYYFSKDGTMTNSSFLDYRIPTALDLPMIEAVLIEYPNPGHPFGLRGVGESSLIPPMAAVANAIESAIGVRVTHLPMNPGEVLSAVQKKSKAE
ncbi:MAG: xanthine dehydrogenase family protein molybdopterin-binding subunit [Dehalococcoidia bacterium]|nr:xanthine dehydrogenase family protein molybdopterin-binding subunit [Dehalococcoidia bacterium]